MRLADLAATSRAVADASGRLEKIDRLAGLLKQTPVGELEIAIAFLSGSTREGRLGVGSAAIQAAAATVAAALPSLELTEVDATFARIASVAGAGSSRTRAQLLNELFGRATAPEQDFLVRLLYGELRQGALEGVLIEAVARASSIPAARIRRAVMLEGSLPPIARLAIAGGASALDAAVVRVFKPVQPMLAETAADVGGAIDELGEASLEYKLDGARIQVHKAGGEVRVYSRTLRDVTEAVPEVVEMAHAMPARELILDGEAIALRPDGKPHPFQITMRRFGRRLDVDRLRHVLPISPFFFDALFGDGASLVDEPLARRLDWLAEHAAAATLVPRLVTASPADATTFLNRSLAAGHEGVMAKSLSSAYAAGRRGAAWLKVKQAHTLDLVVLAVEWGSGRRRGTLSNLHLGARDAERGGFVMLGKTFKGLTDEMLAWQTRKLLALEIARDAHTVYVKPELVVEIAFNDLQESPQYPGRLALRFARVKRYREDKAADQADTFQTVQQIYQQATGLEPPQR
jgi:DNA ligase-1